MTTWTTNDDAPFGRGAVRVLKENFGFIAPDGGGAFVFFPIQRFHGDRDRLTVGARVCYRSEPAVPSDRAFDVWQED